jgi:hypothetical protein
MHMLQSLFLSEDCSTCFRYHYHPSSVELYMFRVSSPIFSRALHVSSIIISRAVHVSGITITHLQERKTTVTTASGNHYTVIDRAFTVKEYL